MTTLSPSQKIEVIAFNMQQEKEVFTVKILESNQDKMLIKKGNFKLIYDKQKDTLTSKVAGLKCHKKVRFFLRK